MSDTQSIRENMSVEELIAGIKNGKYEYTVNLGEEGEKPMTGVSLQEATQLPDKDTLNTFSNMFDDVFIKLANTIQESYGTTRAHNFGEIALNFASVNPKVEASDIPELVSFHGVSEREAKQYITFHEMFAGKEYEHELHIPTAIKLGEVYNVDTAIGLLDVIYAEGIELNDAVFDVWSDVHAESIHPDEMVESLAENGVDDIKSAVMAVYVLEASEFPDDLEQQVESKLESLDVDAVSRDNDSAEETDVENTDDERTGDVIIDAYIDEIMDAESDDEKHKLIQAAFDDINALETGHRLDVYWQIGYAMKVIKNEFGINYTELMDEFDVGISNAYGTRTRNLVDVYDYKEYPSDEHNIGLTEIYTISRESNTTQQAKQRVDRLKNCEHEITRKKAQAWSDVETPTPENIIEACKENGLSVTARSVVPIVRLFDDDTISKADMEPHVDDLTITPTEQTTPTPTGDEGERTTSTESAASENGVIKGFTTNTSDIVDGEHSDTSDSTQTVTEQETPASTGSDVGEEVTPESSSVEETSDVETTSESTQTTDSDRGVDERGVETLTEYVEILRRDDEIEIDEDTGVVRTQDTRYKETIEELFSPTIPSENIVAILDNFTALQPVSTGNRFWEAYIAEYTDTAVTNATHISVDSDQDSKWGSGTKSDDSWFDETVYDTPYDVANHTSTPLLLTHPERGSLREQKHIASAVTTYIANGGGAIVYIGDCTATGSEQPVRDAITTEFNIETVATPVQWEANNDSVTVFTRSGSTTTTVRSEQARSNDEVTLHEVME